MTWSCVVIFSQVALRVRLFSIIYTERMDHDYLPFLGIEKNTLALFRAKASLMGPVGTICCFPYHVRSKEINVALLIY